MEHYVISFNGGKTNNDTFKSELYHYIDHRITKFFTYDGKKLELDCNEHDLDKIKMFVARFNGNIIAH